MKCDWCPPKWFVQFPGCFQLYPGNSQKKNPGNLQDVHALAHKIMPKFFDGIELEYIHRLGPNKFASFDWILSHTRPSGFRFGGIYTFRMHDDLLQTPTIQADINPTTLASNVRILYYPFDCLRWEAAMQRADYDMPLTTQMTLELTRPCSTYTANLHNLRSDSGRSTLSFMKSITDRWAIGSELLLEWNEPKSVMAETAFAARYSHYNSSIATTISRQGLDITFWQRLNQNVQMASLFAWRRQTEKSIATVCYQWNFEDAIVRGMFDSDLSVGFIYYKHLRHIPCGLGMSLLISLPSNRFLFGLKFNLDPSGFRRGD